MPESGGLRVRSDASEPLEEPCAYLAEHHVVVGYVPGSLQVPVLQQGRGSVDDPPAP